MAEIYYARIAKNLTREQKLQVLKETRHIFNLALQPIVLDEKYNWITQGLETDFETFIPIGSKAGKAVNNQTIGVIFKLYSNGIKTCRDAWAYNFDREELEKNMRLTIDSYNEHVFRYSRLTTQRKIDNFVTYDDKKLSWSESLKANVQLAKYSDFKVENIRTSLYRPFTKRYLYFDRIFNERVYQFPSIFPTLATEKENQIIWLKVGMEIPMFALCTNQLTDSLPQSGSQVFPFYTYSEGGEHRQENVTNWALIEFRTHYHDDKISKWDIFYYVYGLLHHAGYREKYEANLKRELPRIPFATDFWTFSTTGRQLADLHLNYEFQKAYPLNFEYGSSINWRVTKMCFNKDKTGLKYNDSLMLHDIPPQVFDYRLGNRSALEWLVDQYQLSTDKRSGIIHNPNDLNEERYIVQLIGKVITVSLATVELVKKISAVAIS
jgi:predicted helicase